MFEEGGSGQNVAEGMAGEDSGAPAPVAVSLEAEVPEVLFDGLHQFLASHPDWSQYGVITSALATFLFQNGCKDPWVNQQYLNGLFRR
jgi:hypothetical protein